MPESKNPAKEHFLAWDKEYAHLKWGGPAPIRDVLARIPLGARVLDAGSGGGRYLGELAGHYAAVGVDVSLIALGKSREQLARSGKTAGHLGASVHLLPFKKASFDGILCYGVLQHLFREEREAAVREFRRVLVDGGIVFFEAFGTEDMRCGGKSAKNSEGNSEKNTFLRQNGIIYHYFTKEELMSLFEGFEILELKDVKKEKIFRGEVYRRHMVRGIFRKNSGKN
ncbi:class I SAM-dependent methyltransferase [Methanosarcina sp. Mfa9]|uniref:class I SAM-dependent methyltransferase n=1 Tax=Methanosarcina sp. Mfa9 TaxID=3439063 RepID=UPI003F84C0EF